MKSYMVTLVGAETGRQFRYDIYVPAGTDRDEIREQAKTRHGEFMLFANLECVMPEAKVRRTDVKPWMWLLHPAVIVGLSFVTVLTAHVLGG